MKDSQLAVQDLDKMRVSPSGRGVLVFAVALFTTLWTLAENRFEVAYTSSRTRRRHSHGIQHQSIVESAGSFFSPQSPSASENNVGVLKPTSTTSRQSQYQVAWVMSFGGSGTSFTIGNLETMTNSTTATNYVEYDGDCVPMIADSDLEALPTKRSNFVWASPCWHRPQKPKPDPPARHTRQQRQQSSQSNVVNVMTKTHCAAYCMDCPVSEYRISDAQQFQRACQAGTRRTGSDATTSFRYPPSLRVSRAIHLIRDPFDNIIGRLHLAMKRRQQRGKTVYDNLKDWCHYLDEKAAREVPAAEDLFPKGFYNRFRHVPCHMEFFRYIQWHNLAYRMMKVKQKQDPSAEVLYLYYEDYAQDFDATTQQLLNFLQLDHLATGQFKAFKSSGKNYRHMFSDRFQADATAMLRDLALPPVWKLLRQRYDLNVEPQQQTSSTWAKRLWPLEPEKNDQSIW